MVDNGMLRSSIANDALNTTPPRTRPLPFEEAVSVSTRSEVFPKRLQEEEDRLGAMTMRGL
jgi:hypothetical protein